MIIFKRHFFSLVKGGGGERGLKNRVDFFLYVSSTTRTDTSDVIKCFRYGCNDVLAALVLMFSVNILATHTLSAVLSRGMKDSEVISKNNGGKSSTNTIEYYFIIQFSQYKFMIFARN